MWERWTEREKNIIMNERESEKDKEKEEEKEKESEIEREREREKVAAGMKQTHARGKVRYERASE